MRRYGHVGSCRSVKSYPTGDADVVNVRENSPESRKENNFKNIAIDNEKGKPQIKTSM